MQARVKINQQGNFFYLAVSFIFDPNERVVFNIPVDNSGDGWVPLVKGMHNMLELRNLLLWKNEKPEVRVTEISSEFSGETVQSKKRKI